MYYQLWSSTSPVDGSRSITTKSITFIDHTNEHHAHVITEVLAPCGFLEDVHRDRDGKIAMTLVWMLANVAFEVNHVAVDGNKLLSTLDIFCDMMNWLFVWIKLSTWNYFGLLILILKYEEKTFTKLLFFIYFIFKSNSCLYFTSCISNIITVWQSGHKILIFCNI